MRTAIRVEGISKRYQLRHVAQGRSRYVALRDVLAEKAAAFFRGGRSSTTQEDFWALRNVSFEIPAGEAVGIIGRNGAGKSTLLKILSRITRPTEGRITLDGRIASLLEVGTGFHPELTGRENIYLNGAILGMRQVEIRRRFDEIVAFADVERFLDTPVKRYSSGMYMRLAFAVAAHLDSEILVVDEVLAVGDAAFQKKCLGKMRDVGQSGRTVLFVSHNMEALARMCTRCVYLVNGRMEMIGDTRKVLAEYSASVKQISDEVDLTRLSRRFEPSGAGRLLRLRSRQPGDASSWCYEYGMPLDFTVDFEVLQPLDDPDMGYSIFSTAGTELLSSTTQQEKPLSRLLPGKYQMRMLVSDFHLTPGTYVLGLGLTSHGRSVDHIADVAQIEILPTDLTIRKSLERIWAPFSPATKFELIQKSPGF